MYRLFIDTPQELEQLKRGDYDNQGYDDVLVKQSASPNIYLEPQYFESNTFPRMQFYDDKLPANNGIILTNSLDSKKGAYANFAAGVQSLEGMSISVILPNQLMQMLTRFWDGKRHGHLPLVIKAT